MRNSSFTLRDPATIDVPSRDASLIFLCPQILPLKTEVQATILVFVHDQLQVFSSGPGT